MYGGWDKLGTLHHEPGSISSGASVAAGLLHIFQVLQKLHVSCTLDLDSIVEHHGTLSAGGL